MNVFRGWRGGGWRGEVNREGKSWGVNALVAIIKLGVEIGPRGVCTVCLFGRVRVRPVSGCRCGA